MTTRSQQIRQRQIAYRMLDSFEALTFISSIRWLRVVRTGLCIFAIVAYWLMDLRFETIPLLLAALVVQIVLFQAAMVEVLRGKVE